MLKKLIKKLKALLYAIPFGMKAADEIVATSNKETTEYLRSIEQKYFNVILVENKKNLGVEKRAK